LIGYKRIDGGDWQATWSVAPGSLVRRTIPVEQFNEATLATLTQDVADKHTQRRRNG
jgi:hypothetical protein